MSGFGNWLTKRSTSDILVLVITTTICFMVLALGGLVSFLVITQPENSHAGAIGLVTSTLQMLVSLLAGFIAGRSQMPSGEGKNDEPTKPNESDNS